MSRNPNVEYTACNLCNSNETTKLADYIYKGEKLSIVECRKCGLIYTDPRLTKAREIELFQDSYYDPSDEEAWNANRAYNYRNLIDKLEKFRSRGKLLDVGCGFGHFLKLAQQRDWQCFGVEPSNVASRYAREKMGLEVKQGELKDANFPPDHFDAIVLWDVLYYYSNPVLELKEINRILKRNGILGIRTVMYKGPLIKFFAKLGKTHLIKRNCPFWNQDWLYHFSVKNLRALLEISGFKIVHISNAIQNKRPDLNPGLRIARKAYSLFSDLIFYMSFGKCVLGPAIIVIAKKKTDI